MLWELIARALCRTQSTEPVLHLTELRLNSQLTGEITDWGNAGFFLAFRGNQLHAKLHHSWAADRVGDLAEICSGLTNHVIGCGEVDVV